MSICSKPSKHHKNITKHHIRILLAIKLYSFSVALYTVGILINLKVQKGNLMFKKITARALRRSLIVLLIAILISGVVYQTPSAVQAQDGQNLPFDALQLGVVQGPQGVTFNFVGQAGDAIAIETAGLNNFAPVVVLQGPDRAVIAQEVNAARSDSVTLSATLPTSGTFFIVVTGVDGTVGQFTILLTRGLPEGFPLTPNGVTEGAVDPTLTQVYYDLPLDPANNTRLEVRSQTLGYSPQVTVFGSDGTVIGLISGNRALASSLEFGPGTEILKVMVAIGEFQSPALYQVYWNVIVPDSSTPSNTPEPSSNTSSSGGCQITPSGINPVNIRSGGSTDHPQVGVLQANETATATGFSALNGGWYEVQLSNGIVGWAASFVVTATGNCSSLPTKTFAPAPSSSGSGSSGSGSSGSGSSGSGSPTSTPPSSSTQEPGQPTPTPTTQQGGGGGGGQVAPPDEQQIFFQISANPSPSERTVVVSDVISYPNGDTADRIRYEVTDFSSVVFSANVLVTVTCSGPGASEAKIASNYGRTPSQPCNGYSRTFTHTNDSRYQNHEIWLESGSDAYVTWTLTATVLD